MPNRSRPLSNAKTASDQRFGDHFVDVNKTIERGSNGQRRAIEPTIAGNVAEILEA